MGMGIGGLRITVVFMKLLEVISKRYEDLGN